MRKDTEVKSIDLYNKKDIQQYRIPGTNETFSLSLPYVDFIDDIKNVIFNKPESDENLKLPYRVSN